MGSLVRWAHGERAQPATLSVRTEQRPTLASSVTLGPTRDATGLPRLRLKWRPSAEDARTGRRLVELLAAELGRAGIGRVEVDPRGKPYADTRVEIGCHPMGTARMSADPTDGVVDPHLRTHDLANLYVCSSAVFPTSGHANPTLTIVALAHRLAARLLDGAP
jgi:choline dehydrogenase-like flavoprotein